MGAADLRDAFNAVAAPSFQCQRAFLGYEAGNGIEWQRLTFSGTAANGEPFEVRSDRVRPHGDVNAEARATAQRLLEQSKKPAPPAVVQEPQQ